MPARAIRSIAAMPLQDSICYDRCLRRRRSPRHVTPLASAPIRTTWKCTPPSLEWVRRRQQLDGGCKPFIDCHRHLANQTEYAWTVDLQRLVLWSLDVLIDPSGHVLPC